MSGKSVAHLTVTLDAVEPPVVRHLEVQHGLRLDRVHLVLQLAMGWTDSHLWRFEAGDTTYGSPEHDDVDAAKATLAAALERAGPTALIYVYDFGDDWRHIIEVERITEPEQGLAYPRLVAATGACPPEDVGGASGYELFLEAMADPDHPAHHELVEWHGVAFDPHDVDVESLSVALVRYARRWSRPPPPPRNAKPKKGELSDT